LQEKNKYDKITYKVSAHLTPFCIPPLKKGEEIEVGEGKVKYKKRNLS